MTESPDLINHARIELAAGGGWNAYREGPHGWVGRFPDEQDARYAAGLGPKYPAGTPEYDAYATELRAELEKWIKDEPPYGCVVELATDDPAVIMGDRPAPTVEFS